MCASLLYRIGVGAFPRPGAAAAGRRARAARGAIQWRMLLSIADGWERPRFPLTGREVMAAGVPEGPDVGRVLAAVEAWWMEEDFLPDETALMEKLQSGDRVRFMSFALLDQLSLPGDPAKPNEDALAYLDHAALVLDGATPLGPSLLPGPSDAAWIAQFGARRLAAHLKDGDAPRDALKHALADTEKSFAGLSRAPIREKWQTPCASMMMVAVGRDLLPLRAQSALAGGPPPAKTGGGEKSSFSGSEIVPRSSNRTATSK